MTERVLVLGADIAAGKCMALTLAADPLVECVIGVGKSDKNRVFAEQIGARVVKIDSENAMSVRKALDGVFAVVRTGWGHKATTVPKIITGPATHIHQISGFTRMRKPTLPSGRFSLGTMYRSSMGVERMAAVVAAMLKLG